MHISSRHSDAALASKGLDLLRQQLGLLVAVAQPAMPSPALAPDAAVSSDGEAVSDPSRDSDDALASQALDLLRQQLVLRVAVARVRAAAAKRLRLMRAGGPSSSAETRLVRPTCKRRASETMIGGQTTAGSAPQDVLGGQEKCRRRNTAGH